MFGLQSLRCRAFNGGGWSPGLTSIAAALSLVLLSATIYASGLHGGYIFDDYANLVDDDGWRLSRFSWSALTYAIFSNDAGALGRPLAMLTFALNFWFTGTDPAALKTTNVAIHLLNTSLTFLLARQLICIGQARQGVVASNNTMMAWLVAGAWGLHPLLVSSVLYIVQRMEIAAHTCILLALMSYVAARRAQTCGDRAWPMWLSALAFTALGIGFKETALLTPAYTFLIELLCFRFVGRPDTHSAQVRFSIALVTMYATGALAGAAVFFLVIIPGAASKAAYATRAFTLDQRLLTQLHALTDYLYWIVVPNPENYRFFYDNYPISTGMLQPATTFAGAALLVALTGSAILLARRMPLYALGIGWFFVAHLLTSNVISLELVFEHRNYSATFGILLAVASLLEWATRRLHQDARFTIGLVIVGVFTAMCFVQVQTWGDPLRLALSLESRNPDSARAAYNLGGRLYERSGGDPTSPQWNLARKEFEHASRLPESASPADQALIIMLSKAGMDIPSSRWDDFRRNLTKRSLGPEQMTAIYSVLECRLYQGCKFDDRQLFETLLAFLEKNPESPFAHMTYAQFSYSVLGDSRLAIDMAREALRLAPHDAQYLINLAKLLGRSHAPDDRKEFDQIYTRLVGAKLERRYPEDFAQLKALANAH